MAPLLSVVVPTFERRAFVAQAVFSVLAQGLVDLEVIVVDDGSTDGTAEEVAAIGDPRVRYVRKEHSGIAASRNRGVRESRGRLIAFLDSDDLWIPGKLEKQLPLLEDGAGFVYGRYRSEEGGRVLRSKPAGGPSGWILLPLLERIFVQMSTAVVTREAIEETGPFDETLEYSDEYDFFLRLAERRRAAFVDEDVVVYRIHAGNESRRRKVRVSENLEVYRRWRAREDLPRRVRRTAARRVARYAAQLGRILLDEGDRKGAGAAFRESLSARPLSPAALLGLVKTHLRIEH